MENNTDFPNLGLDEQSLSIVKAFMPDFYEYLRINPKAVTTLLRLQKEGNEKAVEIITYLIGTPPVTLPIGDHANIKFIRQSHYKGSSGYNLSWGNFKIDDREKDKPLVELDFEATFDKEEEYYQIKFHILISTQPSLFVNKFLFVEVAEWLKEQGYKFKRSNPTNNTGIFSSYVTLTLDPIDWREDPQHPGRKDFGFAKTVRGKCIIQILPLP